MHNSTVLDNIIIRNNNINYTKISFDINNTINLLFLLMDDFGGFDDGYGYDDGYVDQVVGMDMVNDGMMQYQEGVILTEMGMPGLGMAEMQMGQMEMMQGETLMQVGMMENAIGYGGYGMGYGMGAVVAAEQALLVAETAALVCMGLGCTRRCCVKVCAPGCLLPCCQKKIMVVNNKPVVYTQPVMNRPINQQVIVNQGFNQPGFIQQGFNQQPMQQMKPIFAGPIYKQHIISWNYNQNAMVTMSHFVDESLNNITKLKIKKEILHNDCFFLKTTTSNSTDHYFAVPRHEQVNWFCSIIWAKLQLQRFNSNLFQEFNGYLEGQIMRKSKFLGDWAYRDVVIDMEGLKSYRSRNQAPTTRIPRVPELWTRFELVEQQTCLVIKLHFEGTKYEYAIPLTNAIYWIRAFASLMR